MVTRRCYLLCYPDHQSVTQTVTLVHLGNKGNNTKIMRKHLQFMVIEKLLAENSVTLLPKFGEILAGETLRARNARELNPSGKDPNHIAERQLSDDIG